MAGKNVFYPIGWDDNGLPTERRIQNLFGIKCNSQLPYKTNWKTPAPVKKLPKELNEISRQNFIEACYEQTAKDEEKYQKLWQDMGLSIDWSQQYETINDHCRTISQQSFLDLLDKGHIYNADQPIMWDTEFQTSVAQADIVDKEVQGHFYDIQFKTDTDETFIISTTRPELLPACIAVVAHPDDKRYKHLFGKKAITPLFSASVPILPALHADPEKGTGILMVCTFGDVHDLEYWKTQDLPLKQIISPEGTICTVTFGEGPFQSVNPEEANINMKEISGLFTKQAKRKIVDLLKEKTEALIGDPRPTTQTVKFYEKGQFPIEYVPTRQWYIKLLEFKDQWIEQGRKIKWHPTHTSKIYEQWVNGLNQDWCISRQRFFGVPFPVWYPINENGDIDYSNPILASKTQLPVDPQIHCPLGQHEEMRGKPGGFSADPNVMDTWATSSMTPQISSHWKIDENRHQSLFPTSMRPQAHEIIRTWAFYTIVKAWFHHNEIPWKNIAISGWVVTESREKMSKSKGNALGPEELIQKYSADALRYWAAKAKLGQDSIFSEKMFSIGSKLITKLFNSSKFVLIQLYEETDGLTWSPKDIQFPLDLCWCEKMNTLINESSEHFENFEYSLALNKTEKAFWDFCDYYIELVKNRSYKLKGTPQGLSALATLEFSLKTFLKLFAPFLPFITEEIWSYSPFSSEIKSLHTSGWAQKINLKENERSFKMAFDLSVEILKAVRAKKSLAQKSIKWPVVSLQISGPGTYLDLLSDLKDDLNNSCSISCEWETKETLISEEALLIVTPELEQG